MFKIYSNKIILPPCGGGRCNLPYSSPYIYLGVPAFWLSLLIYILAFTGRQVLGNIGRYTIYDICWQVPILTYGAENWITNDRIEKGLQASEMKYLRFTYFLSSTQSPISFLLKCGNRKGQKICKRRDVCMDHGYNY